MRAWVVSVGFLTASTAYAGNDDEILVGNAAAMSGGAVTAIVNDGSALYYNPAGLTGVPDDTIDVSGSAYTLRLNQSDGILVGGAGGTGGDEFTEIVIVPSALAFVRKLTGKARLAVGVFTLQQSDLNLRARVDDTLDSGTQEELLLTLTDKRQLIVGSAGVGWALDPNLQVGVSLSVGYFQAETALQLGAGVTSPEAGTTFLSLSQLDVVSGVGVYVTGGVQWQFADQWRFGAALELPAALIYLSRRRDFLFSAGSIGGAIFDSTPFEESGFGWEAYTPLQVRLGVAHQFNGKSWISLDGEVSTPLVNREISVDRKTLVNVRIGGEYWFEDEWSVGGGLFTDRAPEKRRDAPIDFYGATVGLRYRRARQLDESVEDDDQLTFETFVAARYAFGRGDTVAVSFDLTSVDMPVQETLTRIDVHEIGLHIGASLSF